MNILKEFYYDNNIPTYLNALKISLRDAVVVYDKICIESKPLTPVQGISKKSASCDLDLTGSPLKVAMGEDCMQEIAEDEEVFGNNLWLLSEEVHSPIPKAVAVQLINKDRLTNNTPSLWCVLDHKDSQRTVLLGTESPGDGWWNRGIVTLQDNCLHSEIDIADMIKKLASKSRTHKNNVLVEISSEYCIMGDVGSSPGNPAIIDQTETPGTVTLCMSWNKPSITFCSSADTVLVQVATVGHPFSRSIFLWKHLCYLQELFAVITEHRNRHLVEIELPQFNSECTNSIPILSRIEEALNSSAGFNLIPQESKMESISCGLQKTEERPNADCIDVLWGILKDCSTYRELTNCLNFIFKETALGNFQLMIRPANPTRLASLLRDVMNGRAAVPCFTGLQPLELLLEAGVEKMCQDYLFLFTNCGLAQADKLPLYDIPQETVDAPIEKSFKPRLTINPAAAKSRQSLHPGMGNRSGSVAQKPVIFQNSRFSAYETLYRFKIFARLQTTIEHLLLAQESLDLGTDGLINLAETVLNKMLDSQDDVLVSLANLINNRNHVLQIPIPTKFVKSVCEIKSPTTLRISLKTKNEQSSIQEVFYYSVKPIFPPSIYAPPADVCKPDKGDISYHYTHCMKIGDRVFM